MTLHFVSKLFVGDLFILELFEKNILMNDDRASKLPMLVLSHPKLFNGLVMNPIGTCAVVSFFFDPAQAF